MSDIQPLKEDVVHAGTIEDPIPQKLIFVKKDSTGAKKVYTLGMGGTTGGSDVNVSNASDTVVGIVKLTDDATLDAPAATGYTALTPNGAKVAIETAKGEIVDGIQDTVNGALDDAIDDALADGGKLDTAIDDAIQDKIESGEIGAGSGEASALVVKPEIITPTEGAVNVASLPTLQATAFKCLLTTETRLHREFELNTVTPDASVLEKQVNADSITLDNRLNPNTQYKWRCRDVTNNGLKSTWTSWTSFTTAQGQTVTTPTITLKGYQDSPTDILSGLTIEGSAFAVSEGEDTHKATSWSIAKKIGTRSNVWESLNDTTHKTQITVPNGTLEKGTAYTLTVIYHGTAAYDSAPAVVDFTTSSDFGTVNAPTLTVEGGPNIVYETPLLTGGAFSNTRDPDTHDMTDWEIMDSTGTSSIWQSLNNTTNKTTITVPADTLQVSTAYKARVRYHGAKYGWSNWTQVDFSTVAIFSTVNIPTISVAGAPNNVMETPTLTGSAFGGANVTHASTDWKILKALDNSEVWKVEGDTTNLTSIRVPKGYLEQSTAYIFMVRYNATEGVSSEWAQTTATCRDEFIRYNHIGVPGTSTFGVGLAEQEDYESVGLKPAANCTDPNDFQYGLYVTREWPSEPPMPTYQDIVAMKWVPKFYIAMLQKEEGTVNLNAEELEALLPYVEVTKEQMQEAQRRSPHNAMVVAPADAFTDEADANSHGFFLMRGFIDNDTEHNGFFISNTLTTFSGYPNNYCLYLGMPAKVVRMNNGSDIEIFRGSSVTTAGEIRWPYSNLDVSYRGNFISTLRNTDFQCCSTFAWAVISVLSFIQGQYANNTVDCAWYDANLATNYPKGINAGTEDCDDSSIVADEVNGDTGKVFVTSGYEKTTHNGSITGITNVNGWVEQYTIGCLLKMSILLKRDASIYDITYENVENQSASCYERHTEVVSRSYWGGDKSSFPDITGDKKDLFGVYPFSANSTNNSSEFGTDKSNLDITGLGLMVCVGGNYNSNKDAGIFARDAISSTYAQAHIGTRAMAYPGGRPSKSYPY